MKNSIEINGIEELHLAVEWLDAALAESGKTIVALYGSMGAGKTTFTGEYCKAHGVESGVSSPTFSIVNRYNSDSGEIFHFDCYRFSDEREALDIGIFEYLDSGSLCLIEWPTQISGILEQCDVLSIEIEAISDTARRFSIM